MSIKSQLIKTVIATASIAVFSPHAAAYEQGDILLHVGPAKVSPDDSSGAIHLNGAALAGTSVSVDDDVQLGITLTYMVRDNIGIELLAATPFSHDISEAGLGINSVATAKQLPPTLTAQYYPNNPSSAFQPYAGIGLNYTIFFDEELSAPFEAALGESDMELDDSFGLALHFGADYEFTDKLSLNAAVWYIDIDTEADISTAAGKVTVDVEVDPWVYMLGLGYKF